jgi:uncharacterized alpha-E superfamily protein
LTRLVDTAGQRSRDERRALCPLVTEVRQSTGLMAEDITDETLGDAVLAVFYDHDQSGGLTDLLRRMHSLVSLVRDRFSGDAWRILNRLSQHPGKRAARLPYTVAQARAGDMLVDLAALSGIEMENMTRGVDWRFLDFGRRLERADRMARLLAQGLEIVRTDEAILNPLLEIADSGMTYRRRYFAEPEIGSLLELLLLEPSNPRGVAFQVSVMKKHVEKFPTMGIAAEELAEKRWLQEISQSLKNCSLRELAEVGDDEDFFGNLCDRLAAISKSLTQRYINLTPPELYER